MEDGGVFFSTKINKSTHVQLSIRNFLSTQQRAQTRSRTPVLVLYINLTLTHHKTYSCRCYKNLSKRCLKHNISNIQSIRIQKPWLCYYMYMSAFFECLGNLEATRATTMPFCSNNKSYISETFILVFMSLLQLRVTGTWVTGIDLHSGNLYSFTFCVLLLGSV